MDGISGESESLLAGLLVERELHKAREINYNANISFHLFTLQSSVSVPVISRQETCSAPGLLIDVNAYSFHSQLFNSQPRSLGQDVVVVKSFISSK